MADFAIKGPYLYQSSAAPGANEALWAVFGTLRRRILQKMHAVWGPTLMDGAMSPWPDGLAVRNICGATLLATVERPKSTVHPVMVR